MIQKLFLKFSLSACLMIGFAMITIPTFGQETIILQEERIADFNPKNILKSRAKGYLFKVGDDELQVIGRKGENLEAVLIQDEEAYKQFKRFKRKITIGKVVFWTGVGTYMGSPFLQPNPGSPEDFRRISLIRLSILVIGGTTTIVYRALAVRNLKKAVKIYNKNVEAS